MMMLDNVECMNHLWSTQLWFAFLIGINVAMLSFRLTASCANRRRNEECEDEEEKDVNNDNNAAAAEMHWRVRKFHPRVLSDCVDLCAIVGPGESGKTTLASDLMTNGGIERWIHVHSGCGYSPEQLQLHLENQMAEPEATRERTGFCIDSMDRRFPTVMENIARSDHDCAAIVTVNRLAELPPAYRSRVDAWFICGSRCRSTKETNRLYEEIGGVSTLAEFSALLDNCTENHGCLVILSKKAAGATMARRLVEDRVFWYKAEQPESS